MNSLRVLVVGKDCPMAEQLEGVGHHVTPVDECDVAVEALQLQNFDAVVLAQDLPAMDLEALAKEVQALNRRSSLRTAVLGIHSPGVANKGILNAGTLQLDGYLPDQAGPDALRIALAGAAVGATNQPDSSSSRAELPVLDEKELREQLDFDTELLLELVDLYHSERKRQSPEMREALIAGDLEQLSRLAHTIKGSLGSLQAPAAREEAQLLEMAAHNHDHASCERLLVALECKLDELEVELHALTRSIADSH